MGGLKRLNPRGGDPRLDRAGLVDPTAARGNDRANGTIAWREERSPPAR